MKKHRPGDLTGYIDILSLLVADIREIRKDLEEQGIIGRHGPSDPEIEAYWLFDSLSNRRRARFTNNGN